MHGYRLGVDLGTTWTAAAVERNGIIDVMTLGERGVAVPSVIWVGEDGASLVGEPAIRRGLEDPTRLAREFKRRVGDPTPFVLGGALWSADALMARLLAWVLSRVRDREGSMPAVVALAHPAAWGSYKLEQLVGAARSVGIDGPVLVPEPVAAATHYASQARVPVGATVAVYDLGGGTFDTAVVRKLPQEFQVLGRPEGLDHFGGLDIDEAVFDHVIGQLGDSLASVDQADPSTMADFTELRARCTEAKEALSSDASTAVPVRLAATRTTIRVGRSEVEAMLRGPLVETIAALRRTLGSADVSSDELHAVLLVGGATRMPLVAEVVAAELGRPAAIDADPKLAIARGAALYAGTHLGHSRSGDVLPADATADGRGVDGDEGGSEEGDLGDEDGRVGGGTPPQAQRFKVLITAGLALAGVIGVAAVVSLPDGNGTVNTTTSVPTLPGGSTFPGITVTGELGAEPVIEVDGAQPVTELVSIDLAVGDGPPAQPGSEIEVNYVGVLTDGTRFDETWERGAPLRFTMGGQLIEGLNQGIVGMNQGGRRLLVIPPDLAYGNERNSEIPPGATLIFVIDLVAVQSS